MAWKYHGRFTEGRIVHYVLPNGEHRAAMIVRAWKPRQVGGDAGVANLHVFYDGSNDDAVNEQGNAWVTSVHYSEDPQPRTWHWIEQE